MLQSLNLRCYAVFHYNMGMYVLYHYRCFIMNAESIAQDMVHIRHAIPTVCYAHFGVLVSQAIWHPSQRRCLVIHVSFTDHYPTTLWWYTLLTFMLIFLHCSQQLMLRALLIIWGSLVQVSIYMYRYDWMWQWWHCLWMLLSYVPSCEDSHSFEVHLWDDSTFVCSLHI